MVNIIGLIGITDWTETEPMYFYLRGILYGVVVSTLFWVFAVPWLEKKWS